MKRLFLFSSVNYVIDDVVKRLGPTAKGMKVVFIETAAEVEKGNKKWLEIDRQSQIDAGFEVTNYTLTGKTGAQLSEDLADFDIIYMSGGNTFYLLQQAQQSGFIEVVRDLILNQNKIYMGSSAGSIVAGPDIWPMQRLDNVGDAPKINGYEGFNLVNFILFPHWGSEHFKELYLNYRLDFAYKDTQYPLIVLTDHQYVLVEDNHYQIIDTTQRSSN